MSNYKQPEVTWEQYSEGFIPELTGVTLNELLIMELPPRGYILSPWLPIAGLVLLYAKRGVGKTYTALEIALAAASGGEFLSFKAPCPVGVLYIDGEMPANTMQERLKKIKERMIGVENMIDPVFITPDLQGGFMPDLGTSGGRESLKKFTEQADLIIIDNISTLCGSLKENEAHEWFEIQQWALSLRKVGKSVLFIHHAGKNGQQRGTSKREDVLDTVISLRHPTNYEESMGACFEWHFEKSRGMVGDSVNPILCRLTDDGWQYEDLGQDNYRRVVDLMNEGLKQCDIANDIGISKSQVSKLVSKGKKEGKIKGK